MTATPDNPGLKNWLSIIALGVIWGGAFLSTKMALDGFGPWWVAAGRVGLAAIGVTGVAALYGQGVHQVKGARSWAFILAFGLTSVVIAMSLLTWGQQHVSSAFAGIAMGAVPLMILPLAYVFSPEEGIGPRRIAGFIVGFLGLLVLVGPNAFVSSGADLEMLGRLACIGCACMYAVGSIITRRSPKMPPLAFASATLWVGAAILVPVAFYFKGAPASLNGIAGYALIYAALIPTAIGAIFRVSIIKSAGSVFMSLTSYMVPVWSVIFGMLILDEQITGTMVIGMLLILSGIGLSQSRAVLALFRR